MQQRVIELITADTLFGTNTSGKMAIVEHISSSSRHTFSTINCIVITNILCPVPTAKPHADAIGRDVRTRRPQTTAGGEHDIRYNDSQKLKGSGREAVLESELQMMDKHL